MNFNSPESFLEKLNNWFNGLIALPLLAVGFGYLELFSGGIKGLIKINIYITVVVITVLIIYAVAVTWHYKKQIKKIASDDALLVRLESYFILSKQFYIKIFAVSMVAVLGLYVTGSVAYAGFYAFLLFLLSIYRPSLFTVATKLGMKKEERKAFIKNSKTVIN